MKNVILQCVLCFVVITECFSQKMGNEYRLNVNNVNLPLDRRGVLANVNIPDPDPLISGSGGKYAGDVFLFSGGFFLSGLYNNQVWANAVAPSTLVQDYIQGVNNDPTNPNAVIYRVRKNDIPFSTSWQDWKDAVNLDADFYDGNGNGIYDPIDYNSNGKWDPAEDRPDLLGDETVWCVYHDGVPAAQRRWTNINPLGIEIRQTVFTYSSTQDYLGNIIYLRYRISNTGSVTNLLDSVYFGIWDDADLGDAADDLIGCDIDLKSQFAYNDGPDISPAYGNNPPSFLVKQLSGPHSYIPGITFIDVNSNGVFDLGVDTPLDTAYSNRGQYLGITSYPGAKNLNPSSAIIYVGGDSFLNDPSTSQQARYFMLGFTRAGTEVNPCTFPYGVVLGGVDCNTLNKKFWFSGNPVTNYGWINSVHGDLRQLHSTGPFKLEAGKPVEIFVAYVVNRGTDALNSITKVKEISNFADVLFNSNFDSSLVVAVSENSVSDIPNDFKLEQNYPNPFNPSTRISWQSPVSSWQTLKVYDILGNEVATLVDEYRPAGRYEVEFDATQLSSGIYFYQLKTGDYLQTKKMIILR